MNREEFMKRLEKLLEDIPGQERMEALQYYNDYFDDAGVENEAKVIISLLSPERVAENIKKDLNQSRIWDGYEEEKVEKGHEVMEYRNPQTYEEYTEPVTEKKGMSTGMVVLLVTLCILASPLLIALLAVAIAVFVTLLSLIIGIAGILFGIVAGVGLTALSLFGTGFAGVMIGFFCVPLHIWIGLAIVGAGLVLIAMGILLVLLTVLFVKLALFVIPGLFKGIGKLFGLIFKRKKH